MNLEASSDSRFVLLNQECALFAFCIESGLTELRKSNLGNKGRFYGALFNLSIGLERLLKLIVVFDWYINNAGAFPSKRALQQFGHRLSELVADCETIFKAHSATSALTSSRDAIDNEVIACLTGFATGGRYSNLDNLESATRQSDALGEWKSILDKIYATDVPERRRERHDLWRKYAAPRAESFVAVFSAGLEGNMHNLSSQMLEAAIVEETARYACLRICRIIKPFRKGLNSLSFFASQMTLPNGQRNNIPFVSEYLGLLSLPDADLLRRKRFFASPI